MPPSANDADAEGILPLHPPSDEEIEAAERVLGVVFDEPRRAVLRCMESRDVQACPGSGKTTLLVAKLHILSQRWRSKRQGICVLSHTNVAREEVQQRLATSSSGARLLSYPHFVGTIQGFVDQFLALPMLRSAGYHIEAIDNARHADYCEMQLANNPRFRTARTFLAQRERNNPGSTVRNLKYAGAELALASAVASSLPCGPDSQSGRDLQGIKDAASRAGLFRYDDMFAWAQRLADMFPQAMDLARRRFPVVFMDEAQDTSELQSSTLNLFFPPGACKLRHRFGDPNQAIYDFDAEPAVTDPFPGSSPLQVPNSKRFGNDIACKCGSLATTPILPTLSGEGPANPGRPTEGALHTIFSFEPLQATRVLPAFGKLLLGRLPESVLGHADFRACAIGRVGWSEREDQLPRHIVDYWPPFKAVRTERRYSPATLSEHVLAGRCLIGLDQTAAPVLRSILRGVVELAELARPGCLRGRVSDLEARLREHAESRAMLDRQVWSWCHGDDEEVERGWPVAVLLIRQALSPVVAQDWTTSAEQFCVWSIPEGPAILGQVTADDARPTEYVHKENGRRVTVSVGTIHSAKGQTHTATLVLETFQTKHDLSDVMEWISGNEAGAMATGKLRPERLRLLFTAMTRPSHLLCLATRRDAIQDARTREKLIRLGWNIVDL